MADTLVALALSGVVALGLVLFVVLPVALLLGTVALALLALLLVVPAY